jgi:hypothetical protein
MSFLNTAQTNALNSISPNAAAAGFLLGDQLEAILAALSSGNLAIDADAWDVDNLAATGRNASEDEDSHNGLNFGYFAGEIWVEGSGFVSIAAGTVLLSASTTNYVEASPAGAVSANTSGFSTTGIPLFMVVTGAAAISSVLPVKPILRALPSAGLPGSRLSTAARTKSAQLVVGTLSATGAVLLHAPSFAATLSKLAIAVNTTIAANDTNYWTVAATNKTSSGSGTTAMLAASDANTTKATGGSGITAYIQRALSLTGTSANLDTAAGDIIEVSFTKTASASNLVGLTVLGEFTHQV